MIMKSNENAVEMRGIVKIYPDGTVALKGVDFVVRKGEIRGLLGENGAGKTTLVEILYGMRKPTKGEIYIKGRKVKIRSPRDAMELGIGMVHQHFTLIPVFTALENIVLGLEPTKVGMLKLNEAKEKVEKLMEETGLEVRLDVPVENLSTGEKQRVEILKMLYRNADILILDEPTAVLTPLEVDELFQFFRKMKQAGKTVIFITHKLREAKAITETITVLRKGKVVGTVKTEDATLEDLAKMMVGREVLFKIEKPSCTPGKPILVVRDLWVMSDRGEEAVKGVSFEVRAGEIFGIAGVEGNGQTELVEAITGLRKVMRGKILLEDRDVTNSSPKELYSMGLGHIPEDRHGRGIMLDFTLAENAILGLQGDKRFTNKFGLLDDDEILSWAKNIIKKFNIDAPGINVPTRSLSGGNQQKLIVGRELMKQPKVIVAAQPTRGLDVAATEYIRSILIKMRSEGKAVLLVSADLDEVLMLSDRMAIMYEGRIMGIAKPAELTREEIGLMMGGLELDEIRRGKRGEVRTYIR